MKTPTKLAVTIVSLLPLVLVAVLIARLWASSAEGGRQGTWVSLGGRQPSIGDLVKERANQCTAESHDAFVAEAKKINDHFEDSYILALSSSRISLTPIVRDLQQLSRDIRDLPTDTCGEIVQDQLAIAYDNAIEMFLNFMQDDPQDADVYEIGADLRLGTAYLEAYRISPTVLIYWDDTRRLADVTPAALPADLQQYAILASLSERDRCHEMRPLIQNYQYLFNEMFSSRFSGLVPEVPELTPAPVPECDSLSDDPPTATPTPTLTATPLPTSTPKPTPLPTSTPLPTRTPRPTVSVEYMILHPQNEDLKNVAITYPSGKRERFKVETTPFSLIEQGYPGDTVEIGIEANMNDASFLCQIIVAGQTIVENHIDETGRLNCRATIP